MTRPGERIRSIAARLFRARTLERVVDPVLADLQWEYGEALERRAPWRARWILVRSYVGLASALLRAGMRSETAPAWIAAGVTWATLTIALVLPPLLTSPWWKDGAASGARLSWLLIPQALPLSIPAGLCVGVLWATRGRVVTWRRLSAVMAIAIAFTAVVWMVLEWMMPGANQGFREMTAARLAGDGRVVTLEPGLSELGLSRLGQRTDPAAVHQYHVLWALCFAAIPLTLLACGLAAYVRRAGTAVAVAIALSYSYMTCIWMLGDISPGPTVPLFVQAWTPNIAFLIVACTLLQRSRRG